MRNEELKSKRARCGRKKKLSKRNERNLVKTVLNNRRLTSRKLAVSVKKDGIKVSDSTIRRTLIANDRKAHRPRCKAKIMPAMTKKWVNWAKTMQERFGDDWSQVGLLYDFHYSSKR